MKKFEYANLRRDREDRINHWYFEDKDQNIELVNLKKMDLLLVLNELGAEGWEVVDLRTEPTKVLLKREII